MSARPDCLCGARYEAFRATNASGKAYTYQEVHRMLMAGPDAFFWRNKSKQAVMRFWSELKRGQWDMIHGYCETYRVSAEDNARIIAEASGLDLRDRIEDLRERIAVFLASTSL